MPMTKEMKKENKQGVKAMDRDSKLKIKGMLFGKYPLSISDQAENDLSFSRLSSGSGTLLKILKSKNRQTDKWETRDCSESASPIRQERRHTD